MWKLICNILEKWGCMHYWEKYNTTNVFIESHKDIPHKIIDTLICNKCGKIKKIEL